MTTHLIPHPGLTNQEWERLLEIDQKEVDGKRISRAEWKEALALIKQLTAGNQAAEERRTNARMGNELNSNQPRRNNLIQSH